MANLGNNPPNEFRPQYRLLVKARDRLPKRFIWQIIHDDGTRATVVRNSSPVSFATMDGAYEQGRPVLAEFRSRQNR